MADIVYDRFLSGIYEAEYQMTGLAPNASPYVILVSGLTTPDQETHDTYADVTSDEVTGGAYIKGGQELTGSVRVVGTAPNKTGVWDAGDVVWENSSIVNASGAVIYFSGGSADTSKPLVAFIDFGALKSSSNGDFKITWNTDGILNLRQG